MGEKALWAVLLRDCGRELARVPLDGPAERGALPLRAMACEGLSHGAAALVIVRVAADERCQPCVEERGAIDTAQRTLGAIGLRLHDYILWHGARCISLRAIGQL